MVLEGGMAVRWIKSSVLIEGREEEGRVVVVGSGEGMVAVGVGVEKVRITAPGALVCGGGGGGGEVVSPQAG